MKINNKFYINKNIYLIKFNNNNFININNKYFYLTKILTIVYKFNINNKNILFLNINNKHSILKKFLYLHTNHKFIFKNFWINGLFSNFFIFKHLHYKTKLKFLFNFKFNYHFSLLIIFNNTKNQNEIKKISILSFLFFKNLKKNSFYFNIPIKYQTIVFYLILYKILKK